MKTVEIVVEEKPFRSSLRYRDEDVVAVVVSFTENALRDKLKAAGGRWYPVKKVWHVVYGSIRGETDLGCSGDGLLRGRCLLTGCSGDVVYLFTYSTFSPNLINK